MRSKSYVVMVFPTYDQPFLMQYVRFHVSVV
jgi:hypothetical protein